MKCSAGLKLIVISNKLGSFGPGVIRLLKSIRETNSIKASANLLGVSYSKALKLLNKIEQEFNISLIEKSRGGTQGGETTLTKTGIKIIESYEGLFNKINSYLDDNFDEYFSWLEEVEDDSLG